MSVQFLVDGYNAIYRKKIFLKSNLEESRRSLISFIERNHPQGNQRNSVTVVFDGKPNMAGSMHSRVAKIIFTEYQSADQKIKKIVDHSKAKKNIVVVTDDKDIQLYVRQLGSKILSIDDFFILRQDQVLGKQRRISYTDEHKINQELKDVWLK